MAKSVARFWSRATRLVCIIIATCVFVTLSLYWIKSNDENISRADLDFNTPISANFTDDNYTTLSNNIPDVNNNRAIGAPDKLIITYDITSGPNNPVFNTTLTPSDLAANIKFSPAIRGKWSFSGPYDLIFSPEQNWPANTRFDVKLGKHLFSSDVIPSRDKFSFKTAPISADLNLFNIYSTPSGDRTVIGVAVISFNEPIQTQDFKDKVSMRLDGRNLEFDVQFDRYMRTVIIKTVPIKVTAHPQTLRLKINSIYDSANNSRTSKITAKTVIDSANNFFKVSDLSTITADDSAGIPQQLILVNMTASARTNTDWPKYIDAYLLPRMYQNDSDNDFHTWARDEVTPEIIQKSEKLTLTPVNFVNPAGTYQYAFSYDVSDDVPRYIYIKIKSDIHSDNGFVTQNATDMVLPVAYPARSVKIVGGGALLSMAGDKNLAIVARGGVDTAFIDIAKVESREINHLITQTYNLFSKLEYHNQWTFNSYDMSVIFHKKIPFANTSKKHVNYAALNLGEYLDRTPNDKTGIFIIKTGADEVSAENADARLILLTDLGIIRKINLDNTSMIFVSYLSTGAPASDTDVTVLGRNGYPIWAGTTNSDGVVNIPHFSLSEYRNEKEPVAIVARHDMDVSFIPYNADYEQRTEFSKFDVGGAYASNTTSLRTFVFSDRGIYAPGESVVIGAIVENGNFSGLAGIPVKMEIFDSRGRIVFERKISLPSDGMFDATYKTSPDTPLGQYEINIYSLNGRGKVQDTIGTTTFMVQEFIPDTMKIVANIDTETPVTGWISPDNIRANISLNNMYGTPATNRRISGTATLRPFDFTFTEYANYKFTSNFISDGAASGNFARINQTYSIDLPDIRTDENGNATMSIDFNREIPTGTYILTTQINGFEPGDGASIQTTLKTRVSNLDYLVGYHTDSDLDYVARNTKAKIKLIALDNNANKTTANNLNVRVIKRENLTSLIKDYNNLYKYKTITNDKIMRQSQITIPINGIELDLNTATGGTYFLQILDTRNNILANIEYFVASNENVTTAPETRAELQIKLNAIEYTPGQEINIGITAPYAGTGLITIERDRVYAYKWFNAKTTSSVQSITLPDDFQGTGYINVSFVRDINSRDIYTTPYAYAVAPFRTKIDHHHVKIDLTTPPIIHDNKLTIEYKTNKDARIMIFAINTGIIQVAKYQIPNPLQHFFQKAALQVQTSQILSLLLPEYNVLREVAKTGGGDYDMDSGGIDTPLTNPFARKNLPPVAFYSGIIDTAANTSKNITFDIPEYFNGELSVYAVAASNGAVGGARTHSLVQSPVIISMVTPRFVAPSDKFTINTIVSNLAPESGNDATAKNTITTTGNLIVTLPESDIISVPKNTEKLWQFNVSATDAPGVATLGVTTRLADGNDNIVATRTTTSDISIRPTTLLTHNIKTGIVNSTTTNLRNIETDMYSAMQTQKLYISASPSILTRPMFEYLADYNFSCTEQLISRTIPYAILGNDALLGITTADAVENIDAAIKTLTNRQNGDGSFGMWTSGTPGTENISSNTTTFVTAYAINFLGIARRGGYNVPQSILTRGMDFLRSFASQPTTSESDAYAKALTIYTLSQNDYVTTSYIDLLLEYLNEHLPNWESGPIGPYIAASYKMLKQTERADTLIAKYKPGNDYKNIDMPFINGITNDAIYTFILRRYFDRPQSTIAKNIQNYINAGNYDSMTAAAIIMGYADATPRSETPDISIFANDAQITTREIGTAIVAEIPINTPRLRINCPTCNSTTNPMFYTFIQTGFPRTVDSHTNGIEITREYFDINGNRITSARIGDMVDVKITARTRGGTDFISNGVIIDLLPGGLTPISDSLTGDMEFGEIREDRVLIYTSLDRTPTTFSYRAQLSVAGTFAIPPITAHDMNNSGIVATGKHGKLTVSNAMDD